MRTICRGGELLGPADWRGQEHEEDGRFGPLSQKKDDGGKRDRQLRWWMRRLAEYAAQVREGLATRLEHERRLGELLAGTVRAGRPKKIIVRDDNFQLPDGISLDLSSHAKTLAQVAPWLTGVVQGVRDGTRRRAKEAREALAGKGDSVT